MKINIGKLQLRMYASILEKRTGVCSQKSDKTDKHLLLWDFDRVSISQIVMSLINIQQIYKLPSIVIIQSSPKGSYHAYSFTARPFRDIIKILADTPEVDLTYLRLGAVRGYYTLRITPRKHDPIFHIVEVLVSKYSDEMTHDDMTINQYLTNNKGVRNAKR